VEDRILAAARTCCERWGIAKTTVDDIAEQARVSRATLYRLFPGGRDVLFAALRDRDITEFLGALDAHLAGAADLEDLVVRIVTHATVQLREDVHLQLMLASEPGEVAKNLGVDSMPNIVNLATAMIGPRLSAYLGADAAAEMAEWLSRLVVSYFLAPSVRVDLADAAQAAPFVRRFVLPAFT
jgi:AcrR family transcriptional regulator